MRLLFLIVAASLVACGGGESGGGGDATDAVDLQGVWQGVCEQSELASYRRELTIDGNTITATKYFWPGSGDCSGPAEQSDLGGYTYSLGEELVTDSGVQAVEMDIQFIDSSQRAYDIFTIDGGTALYFGDPETGDQNTLATRPTDLDFDQPYTRGS